MWGVAWGSAGSHTIGDVTKVVQRIAYFVEETLVASFSFVQFDPEIGGRHTAVAGATVAAVACAEAGAAAVACAEAGVAAVAFAGAGVAVVAFAAAFAVAFAEVFAEVFAAAYAAAFVEKFVEAGAVAGVVVVVAAETFAVVAVLGGWRVGKETDLAS